MLVVRGVIRRVRESMSNSKNEADSLNEKKYIAFEKIMHVGFFTVFLVLIIVQAAIFIPSIKPSVIDENSRIGVPIGREEYLYKEGSMVLTLIDFEKYPALRVMVNGEEKASFETNTVDISVCDGDVVELDGSMTNANSTVKVTSASSGIEDGILGKSFVVGKEVIKLFKVRISK